MAHHTSASGPLDTSWAQPPAPMRAPFRAELAALVQALWPGARVTTVRRLRGGMTSRMHAVSVRSAEGARRSLVLRRYIRGRVHSDETTARREFRTLDVLAAHGIAAPAPVWLDAGGERFGAPAMITSRLPGRPRLRAGDDASGWLGGLVEPLVAVHALTPANADLTHLGLTLADGMRAELARGFPPELVGDDRGERIVAVLGARIGAVATETPALVHDDYFPGNVLWHRGRVSGVVDWQTAEVGDPRADVAQLRLDLAMMHGPDLAEAVPRAYLAAGGCALDALWYFDLFRGHRALATYPKWLPGYHDLGLTEVTPDVAGARLRAFLDGVLARVDA